MFVPILPCFNLNICLSIYMRACICWIYWHLSLSFDWHNIKIIDYIYLRSRMKERRCRRKCSSSITSRYLFPVAWVLSRTIRTSLWDQGCQVCSYGSKSSTLCGRPPTSSSKRRSSHPSRSRPSRTLRDPSQPPLQSASLLRVGTHPRFLSW